VFYRHQDGRTTTVPNHPGRDIARPLLREVLREVDLTPEQFERALHTSEPTASRPVALGPCPRDLPFALCNLVSAISPPRRHP
jgi:hypothetical protein